MLGGNLVCSDTYGALQQQLICIKTQAIRVKEKSGNSLCKRYCSKWLSIKLDLTSHSLQAIKHTVIPPNKQGLFGFISSLRMHPAICYVCSLVCVCSTQMWQPPIRATESEQASKQTSLALHLNPWHFLTCKPCFRLRSPWIFVFVCRTWSSHLLFVVAWSDVQFIRIFAWCYQPTYSPQFKTTTRGIRHTRYPTELSWLILTVWLHRCPIWREECPCTLVLAAIYWVS